MRMITRRFQRSSQARKVIRRHKRSLKIRREESTSMMKKSKALRKKNGAKKGLNRTRNSKFRAKVKRRGVNRSKRKRKSRRKRLFPALKRRASNLCLLSSKRKILPHQITTKIQIRSSLNPQTPRPLN
jgi:hypothetical protein